MNTYRGYQMNITPNKNKVLLKLDPVQTTSDGGIILPGVKWVGTEEQDFRAGEVLAIGPLDIDSKGNRVPIEFKVGDNVLVTDYHTTPIGGIKDVHFAEHKDVVAILEAA